MSYNDIKIKFPEEYEARQKNRLYYRFPGAGGESYADVIERLKPIIIEIERMTVDAVVVSHNVTMRTLLAYFTGIAPEKIPKIKIPLHSVYCLEPTPYGADLKRYSYNSQMDAMEFAGNEIEMFE
jgi:6-phosphofructo-2-kinase